MLSLAGEWIVAAGHQLEAAGASLISLAKDAKSVIFDFARLQRMDTAGAWFIDRAEVELEAAGATVSYRGEQPKHDILLKEAGYHAPEKSARCIPPHTIALLSAVGETVYGSGVDFFDIVDYLGEIVVMFLRLAPQPWRWRWTPMVHHLEMYGLRSVPIIVLINFLVGAIVTQQGIFQLNSFGASSYAVNLVGVLGLRELGVLMTSIMIAGRTGSAITAEIGSMKMREEIDALKVMALDPAGSADHPAAGGAGHRPADPDLPRRSGEIAGGLLVGWLYAGLTPAAFLLRLQNAVLPETFLVGLIKAPFMAMVIGLIAATEGMEVGGSAESLGRCVTSSVVKSIFMVIVMDGLFAMFFATVNY